MEQNYTLLLRHAVGVTKCICDLMETDTIWCLGLCYVPDRKQRGTDYVNKIIRHTYTSLVAAQHVG